MRLMVWTLERSMQDAIQIWRKSWNKKEWREKKRENKWASRRKERIKPNESWMRVAPWQTQPVKVDPHPMTQPAGVKFLPVAWPRRAKLVEHSTFDLTQPEKVESYHVTWPSNVELDQKTWSKQIELVKCHTGMFGPTQGLSAYHAILKFEYLALMHLIKLP